MQPRSVETTECVTPNRNGHYEEMAIEDGPDQTLDTSESLDSDEVRNDDGDTVAIVYGPQGGWHIDATLRFGGFGPGGISIAYEAVGTDAERISFVTQAELVEFNVLEADEGWVRVGDRIVLDIRDPSEVVGREAILRVTAALGDQTWSDERRVQIVDAR